MAVSAPKSHASIGFLTVREHEGQGLFGGYLLLNTAGRPLEFYCTTPVRPNRAQEILYGPTLKPYLYGEQIGRTLLEKAKTKPLLVFTDVEPALSVREYVPYPVVLVVIREPTVQAEPAGVSSDITPAAESASAGTRIVTPKLQVFSLGEETLAVLPAFSQDVKTVSEHWQAYATEFDVREPFQRICEAIDEARRSAKQAA
jgi:hypothetical protein